MKHCGKWKYKVVKRVSYNTRTIKTNDYDYAFKMFKLCDHSKGESTVLYEKKYFGGVG